MDKNAFEKREASYEAAYFHQKDAELVAKLRKVFHQDVDKNSISAATGVTNPEVLERLADLNLTGELMAAFTLLPLVQIAWADGKVDEKERTAVLNAAIQQGIAKESKAYAWLDERLSDGIKEEGHLIWNMYAGELKKTLTAEELETFRNDIIELAKRVADASGGLFSFGFNISPAEQKVINALQAALSK